MDNISSLIEKLSSLKEVSFRENVLLAPYTSYQIGGPGRLMLIPETECAIAKILKVINETDIPLFVLGSGSNVLIPDEGFPGVTLLMRDNFSGIQNYAKEITALSGTMLLELVKKSADLGLAGMESLAGIPSTVGGALRMNAGAYGQEIGDITKEVYGYTRTGQAVVLKKEEISFKYRNVAELEDIIITSAVFRFEEGKSDILKNRIKKILDQRKKKQPLNYPSCGSVFKRPEGHFAGALIEKAGLKGTSIGDAMISEKHAGFIVNRGNATFNDVLKLIELAEKKVLEMFDVKLEREVKILSWN